MYLVDVAEDELAVVDGEEGREEWIQQRVTSRGNTDVPPVIEGATAVFWYFGLPRSQLGTLFSSATVRRLLYMFLDSWVATSRPRFSPLNNHKFLINSKFKIAGLPMPKHPHSFHSLFIVADSKLF
jgi:hypothetical protein